MAKDRNGLEYRCVDLDQYDVYEQEEVSLTNHIAGIGAVLVSFSNLELVLDNAIAFIIQSRHDLIGVNVARLLEYEQKVQLYMNLCRAYLHDTDNSEMKRQLKAYHKDLLSAGEIRNIVAHARWFSLTKDGFVRSTAKIDSDDGRAKFKYYKLTPEVLSDLDIQVAMICETFGMFLSDLSLL